MSSIDLSSYNSTTLGNNMGQALAGEYQGFDVRDDFRFDKNIYGLGE